METVSIDQASRELNMSKQSLRIYMQKGLLDIGIVLPNATGKTKKFKYVIFREKLDRLKGEKE